jgi:regulator of sigma E protease
MSAFIIFLLILSILIIVHEFGHFFVAKRLGVRVEKFSFGFGRPLLKKKKDDTEYCINSIPLGGYVKLSGDNLEEYQGRGYEYFSKAAGKRFWIIFFGPLLNYILGFLFFWVINFVGYPMFTTKVGGLLNGFGAKDSGIQIGDKVIAVDGKKVDYWEDLQKIIHSLKTADEAKLLILRDNKEFEVKVKIREQQLEDEIGQRRSIGLLGITPSDEIIKVRHNFLDAFFLGLDRTLDLTIMTYKGLWRMITGKLSFRESVTGPLGIFYVTSKAASLGVIAVLHLIAVLNVSLAIFNLLPLPVLDGGHILFLGIEKIRGKTLSTKTEQIITQIGLTVIISLAVFVTYNDITRLFGDKISKIFMK